jgi:hypothetical protein
MNHDDGALKDGPPEKSFRLWHVQGTGEFVAFVAEADTFEEIKKIRRRADWRYQITHNGSPIDDIGGYPLLRLPGDDVAAPE